MATAFVQKGISNPDLTESRKGNIYWVNANMSSRIDTSAINVRRPAAGGGSGSGTAGAGKGTALLSIEEWEKRALLGDIQQSSINHIKNAHVDNIQTPIKVRPYYLFGASLISVTGIYSVYTGVTSFFSVKTSPFCLPSFNPNPPSFTEK